MFRKLFIVFICLFSTTIFADQSVARPHYKISILFIGNSFTSSNNLPQTFATIADSLGDHVDFQTIAPGGYTLQQHANTASTISTIQSGHWNFVVLQEQSELIAFPAEQYQQMSLRYAQYLDQFIHESNAKTVIYETWGYKDGDPHFCSDMSYFCSYDGMQQAIAVNTYQLMNNLSAILSPVGYAWRTVRQTHPEIDLYQSDNKHPSVAGTYLAACVFYDVLFGRSAVGATPLSLDSSTAAILQKAADQAVYGNISH